MGDDFCKAKGVEIGQRSATQTYVGLLTIKASTIREIGSSVQDSRSEWLGHADLDHGFAAPPPDDPGSATELERMTERCRALKDASRFHLDPTPEVTGWRGAPLKLE
jgi:hypothetical protein